MSRLLVKSAASDRLENRGPGCVVDVTPESAGWKYVGFRVYRLEAGQKVSALEKDREVCVVVLSGKADVTAGDRNFGAIGERDSVFQDMGPAAVFVPANNRIVVTGVTETEVAFCSAPGSADQRIRYIAPQEIEKEVRGEGTNTRMVRAILPQTEPADSLLIYEVITPAGNWSSYPPHKHDTDRIPAESALEETYYHLLNPPQGFAFQRVYTDDRSLDETMAVEHGDCVLVPKGYHPVGAPHGYDLYYLNVMAGPTRTWIFHNDPDHEWMLER